MIHHRNMSKRCVVVALLVVLPVSLAGAAPTGKITVRSTETLKPQDVTNGGVSGTGRFTVSGAIRDNGAVTDYRTVKGGGATVSIRRVVVGEKGTITFRLTIHVGTTSPRSEEHTSELQSQI